MKKTSKLWPVLLALAMATVLVTCENGANDNAQNNQNKYEVRFDNNFPADVDTTGWRKVTPNVIRNIPEGKSIADKDEMPIPPRDPDGAWKFNGWNTAPDGSDNSPFDESTKITNNIDVYAQWQRGSSYTVTFIGNGGTFAENSSTQTTRTVTAPAATVGSNMPSSPTRTDGYTFDYWEQAGGARFDGNTAVTGDITVTAKWAGGGGQQYSYTVTFSANGGTFADGTAQATRTVNAPDTMVGSNMPSSPTRTDGYTFDKWTWSGGDFTAGTPVTGHVTVTAQWVSAPVGPATTILYYPTVADENNVFLHVNVGSISITRIFLTTSTASKEPSPANAVLFDFAQGITPPGNNEAGNPFGGPDETGRPFYWTNPGFGNLVEGSGTSRQYVLEGTGAYQGGGGFGFEPGPGIYLAFEVTTEHDDLGDARFTNAGTDPVYFNQLVSGPGRDGPGPGPNPGTAYTVTFNANGATSGSAPGSMTQASAGAAIQLPNQGTLLRTDYTFGGWSETASGAAVGASYTPSANTQLFAVWTYNGGQQPTSYTVTFNANGGTFTENSQATITRTVAPNNAVGTIPAVNNRPDYNLTGWTITAGGSGPFTAAMPVTGNITVTAQWTPISNPPVSYTVTFNANGGTFSGGAATQIVTVTGTGTLTVGLQMPGNPTNGNNTFKGWWTAQSGGTQFTEGTSVTQNTTVYAQWTPPLVTTGVVTYPWPGDAMPKYQGITMAAGGQNIDLYSVRANNTHTWNTGAQNLCDQVPVGMFDVEGTAQISITLNSAPGNVIVRPLGKNITPQRNGGTVTFAIPGPGQYSFEYSDNPKDAVLIFANPIEDFSAIEGLRETIVREAGIYTGGETVPDRYTLYLKPGAVIRGDIRLNSNAKIVGRGIIDGSHLNDHISGAGTTLPIETSGANNIEISGITIFDTNAWNVQLQNTSNITIDNLKIVSSRCNSDGISLQNSNTATITNSFLRTWDDGVVIKNYTGNACYDITVKNCIFWTDLAQCMEVGVETNKGRRADPKIYGVLFEDITVLHALHKAPISVHNGDNAEIYDITWRNIVIEDYNTGQGDGWNYLIDITNLTGSAMGGAAGWTAVQERGNIRDVLIENVRVLGGRNPTDNFNGRSGARFRSDQGGSTGVTVKDIYYRDNKITNFGEVNAAQVNWQ